MGETKELVDKWDAIEKIQEYIITDGCDGWDSGFDAGLQKAIDILSDLPVTTFKEYKV